MGKLADFLHCAVQAVSLDVKYVSFIIKQALNWCRPNSFLEKVDLRDACMYAESCFIECSAVIMQSSNIVKTFSVTSMVVSHNKAFNVPTLV